MALKTKILDTEIKVGDTINVTQEFMSGDKIQKQIFTGIVMGIKGRQEGKSFTVRKISSDGIGVEKIWPVLSPNLVKVEVKRKGNPRRAKLNYLRSRIGKGALKVKAINK
ncbi:MAG: 50S ribosomal protein L19 [Candidatus Beckwithbacteria bacterium]|nr:50S ribosomal protein L19 [Patescibacteria group bacterium]